MNVGDTIRFFSESEEKVKEFTKEDWVYGKDVTEDDIQSMTRVQLIKFIQDNKLDIIPSRFRNTTALKEEVISEYFGDDVDEDELGYVAVKFPQEYGWSKKRYIYFSEEDEFDVGDWVIVDVVGKDKCVLVVANEDAYLSELENSEINSKETAQAKKHIKRLATPDEVRATKKKYPKAIW